MEKHLNLRRRLGSRGPAARWAGPMQGEMVIHELQEQEGKHISFETYVLNILTKDHRQTETVLKRAFDGQRSFDTFC